MGTMAPSDERDSIFLLRETTTNSLQFKVFNGLSGAFAALMNNVISSNFVTIVFVVSNGTTSTLKWWKNGVLQDASTITYYVQSGGMNNRTLNRLWVGHAYNMNNPFCDGFIRNFAIYDSVLSDADASSLCASLMST